MGRVVKAPEDGVVTYADGARVDFETKDGDTTSYTLQKLCAVPNPRATTSV